jgi:PAS domain S-box-containing protein
VNLDDHHMLTPKAILIAALAGLFLLVLRPDGPVAAAEAQLRTGIVGRQPRVLVIYSNERLLPANFAIDEAIRTTFESEFKGPAEFYIEFLDVDRFPGEAQPERTQEFLEVKYSKRPPDVVIAVGESALKFLIKRRANLFPHVPVVHCAVEPNEMPKLWPDDLIVGIPQTVDVVETLELALRLQPDTRQVAIVNDINSVGITPADVAPLTAKVGFLWLTNRSIPELRTELSRLPDHTVVYYDRMFRDPAGNAFIPRAALDQFAPASRVPIYGQYDTYLGHGIVGGSMITFETIGRSAAQIAIRILKGQKPEDAARGEMHVSTPMFDWRELKRWDLPESRLPSGSVVLFRETPIWRKHALAVAGGLGIVALETWLIARLLLQRRHRRRAESELRESEQRFRSLADTAPVMIWMSGPDQKCNYFNQRWLDFTGRPPEAELGDGWIASVHPDDVGRRVLGYRDAFESRAPLTVEYRLRRHDGQYRWILAQAVPRLTGITSNTYYDWFFIMPLSVCRRRASSASSLSPLRNFHPARKPILQPRQRDAKTDAG